MEKEPGTSSTKSDIIFSTKNEEEQGEEEEEEDATTKNFKNPNLDKGKRWSSRLKCYSAYFCSITCYSALQENYHALDENGILAFVPFILFRIFIGIPAIIIQIMLGRYIMTNLSQSWSMHVTAKGILYCEIALTAYYTVYSLVVTSYLMEYMFLSFSTPWKSCNVAWATISCYESQHFQFFLAKCLKNNSQKFCMNLNWETSELQYWTYVAANPYNSSSVFLTIFFSFTAAVTVFAMAVKGFKTAEKSFEVLAMTSLTLALLSACVICVTPEFSASLRNIFTYQLENLLDLRIWVTTYQATIFVLGIGRLPLIFISSNANFEDNMFTDVLVVCFSDIFCLLITIPVFFVIEHINSHDQALHFSDALDIFTKMSEMVLLFPSPQVLCTVIYYLLLALITLSSLGISTLALVQTIIDFAPDRFNQFYTSFVFCIICFFSSLIFFFNNFRFSLLFDKSILSVLFLYLLTLKVFYGFQVFNDDFQFMMGHPVPFFLKLAWIISLPLSFVMIILSAVSYNAATTNTNFYIFLGIPILIYILAAAIQIGIEYQQTRKISQVCLPNPNWGPANPLYRKSRILFDSRAVTKEFMYRQELQEKPFIKPPDISEQAIIHVI